MQAGNKHRRCNCCQNFLTASDKEKALKLKAKYRKCLHCEQVICRFCQENGRCHECTIRLTVGREPDEMMKLSRVQLLAYLTILHYPKEVMETWQKPYLVKQMLTRFNIYPDWNPADYTTNQGTMVVSPTRPRTTMHLPTASKQGPRRPNKDVNNSPENHIYDLPITTDQTKNQPANKKESAPPKPQRLPSLRKSRCSSLKDITSADRFDAMSASDLNIFLKQWLDDECRHPGRAEDLRFVLKYLWDKNQSRSDTTLNDVQCHKNGPKGGHHRGQVARINPRPAAADATSQVQFHVDKHSRTASEHIHSEESKATNHARRHPRNQPSTSHSEEWPAVHHPSEGEEQTSSRPSKGYSPKTVGRSLTMLPPSSELFEIRNARKNLKSISKKLP